MPDFDAMTDDELMAFLDAEDECRQAAMAEQGDARIVNLNVVSVRTDELMRERGLLPAAVA